MPTDLLLLNSSQKGFYVPNKSTNDHSRENLEASKIPNPRNSKKIQTDEIPPKLRSNQIPNTEDDNWHFPLKKKMEVDNLGSKEDKSGSNDDDNDYFNQEQFLNSDKGDSSMRPLTNVLPKKDSGVSQINMEAALQKPKKPGDNTEANSKNLMFCDEDPNFIRQFSPRPRSGDSNKEPQSPIDIEIDSDPSPKFDPKIPLEELSTGSKFNYQPQISNATQEGRPYSGIRNFHPTNDALNLRKKALGIDTPKYRPGENLSFSSKASQRNSNFAVMCENTSRYEVSNASSFIYRGTDEEKSRVIKRIKKQNHGVQQAIGEFDCYIGDLVQKLRKDKERAKIMHVEGGNFEETSDYIQSLREMRRKFLQKNIVEKRARDDTMLDRVHSVLGSGNPHNIGMDKKSIRSFNRASSARPMGYKRSITLESPGVSPKNTQSQFTSNVSNRS
jgi:hypothetical protein